MACITKEIVSERQLSALKKSCIVNQNAKMTAAYAESREKSQRKVY